VRLEERAGVRLLVFERLAASGLSCAHSTTPLDVRRPGERRALVRAAGLDPERVAATVQVHGASVLRVDAPPDAPPDADALVTAAPGLALLMKAADCSLVVVADPARRAVGVAHAGWRGAAAGVVEGLVAALSRHFGSRPADLLAGVGPTIGVARYAVGTEVLDAFRRRVPWADACARPVGSAVHFDLAAANARALAACGIPADAIEVADLCTHERGDLLHSYRREGPGNGHHGLVAGWA
jgi:hypothetical protein